MDQITAIDRHLKKLLSPDRLAHCHRVSETCVALAKIWNADTHSAALAGLIHDIAKELNPEKLAAFGIPHPAGLRDCYRRFKKVWHAFAGPLVVQHQLNINDSILLNAIQWHATGKGQMGLLDKLVYIADAIEPERTLDNRDQLRHLAETDLNLTVYLLSTHSIQSLLQRHLPIHPCTLSCRNYYIRRLPSSSLATINRRST